jgi:transcriptional regulator
MYLPESFAERDPARLAGFLAEFPLGLLIAVAPASEASPGQAQAAGPSAHLVPFDYLPPARADAQGGGGLLRAHVARANPVWREAAGAQVLVVFQGPQAHVSPSAYPGKAVHGKVVPTWNYAMVQARGALRVVDDAAWLRTQVTALTATHEASRPVPWSPDDAPQDYIDALLRAIVGIEIAVTALVGKWKLGQNRPLEDQRGVLDALRTHAHDPGPGAGTPAVSGARWLQDAMEASLRARSQAGGDDA